VSDRPLLFRPEGKGLLARILGGPPRRPERIEPRLEAAPAPEQKDAGGPTSTLGGLGWPQPMLYAALGGYASNTGVPVTPFTALQAAAVYACVKFISQDIAMLRPFLRRRIGKGQWVLETRHPLLKILAKPNPWQTRFEFMSYWVTSLLLRGNGFVVVERDQFGEPTALVPVAPDRVTIMLSPEGDLWYRINSHRLGYGIVIPQDDMLHLKNISMDGYVGVSPIAIAQDVIGLALATQQHGGILFRQGGQIGGVITHPGRLSKEASERIGNSWRETHSGVQNAHKVAILEEGMQFAKIAMTNEDAQFLETRRFQVIDICRLYGVPPHKLGELDKATLNNIEQQSQQYVDAALKPIAESISQLFDAHLLFEDERVILQNRMDFDEVTRGDLASRYSAYQIGVLNGWLSRNEVRAKENMDPIEGGDEYRVPLNTGDPTKPENMGQQIPSGGDNADSERDSIQAAQ
jgi:HK97 family phage portal protein